jgi:hypothetical protein
VGSNGEFLGDFECKAGAGDGLRTRYLDLGKVALYQVSYSRSVRRRFYPASAGTSICTSR